MAELHPPLGGIHEAALYVSDLERAERFWRRLGLPLVGRARGRHAFFRAGSDLLLVFDPRGTVASAGVPIEHEQEWPGGGRSLYFRDPDGNSLELITRGTWGF